MESQENKFSASKITYRSLDEHNKQATDPIRRRMGDLCALLVGRPELELTGNSETNNSRRDNTSATPLGNRHNKHQSGKI